jgi:tRNA(Ile)-lysidine synthase
MNPFESRFKKFICDRQLLIPGQSVLLAVSGGVDSMVMLHLFSRCLDSLNLQLSVLHVNHQLRGEESMGDEQFVQEMSDTYGIPCTSNRIDVLSHAHKLHLSKQLAARQLRYQCFEKIRSQGRADVVATAHHADDNAETVLLNILRGTGIHGLAGIPLKREEGCIIRPLLFATRKEIEAYAASRKIQFRTDSSNRSLMYRRNELRNKIIPILQSRTPHLVQTLNHVAVRMQDVNEKMRRIVDQSIQSMVQRDSMGNMLLDLEILKRHPDFLWDEIFVGLLQQLNIEPTEKKVHALHRLCMQPTGRRVVLQNKVAACRDRNHMVFKTPDDGPALIRLVECGKSYGYNNFLVSISSPERVPSEYTGTHEVEYVDGDRLGRQLVLRTWHPGDWFIPLGMKTKKKLSDFFTDQKVPRYQKSSIPVLESNGTIVWICGKRLDDRFKLTDRTKTAIRLTCQPLQRASHG